MNSIEQAREARDYVARYGGRCRDCADHDGICPTSGLPCNVEDCNKAIDHVIKALNYGIQHGFLSPSTPVDGVGAEPRVKPLEWVYQPDEPQGYTWRARKPFGSSYYIHERDGMFSWNSEYTTIEVAKAAAQADYERRILSALASPEAEARLRERVAEAEAACQENAEAWEFEKNRAEAAEADARMWESMFTENAGKAAAAVVRSMDAEARLAQAEGGQRVTDEAADYDAGLLNDFGGGNVEWWQDYLRSEIGRANDHWRSIIAQDDWPTDGTCIRCGAVPRNSDGLCNTCVDEAALHPQSAAGEEGKP